MNHEQQCNHTGLIAPDSQETPLITQKGSRILHTISEHGESGQSIVLIALALIVLLAFTGIAVDTGYVFVRQTQLRRAVDAAVLAGVTEILDPTDKTPGDRRAQQFMLANDLPITLTQGINYESEAETTALGAIQFTVTATWPVELFFLPVINWRDVRVTESATAAYFPLTEVYASRRIENGILSTSNQSVFGPYNCSGVGDPFSPINPLWSNGGGGSDYAGFYTYQYRILIPGTYPEDVLRVELFDPDGINNADVGATVIHSDSAVGAGEPTFEDLLCDPNGNTNSDEQGHFCLIDTGEANLGIPLNLINPYWFIRVDSNNRGNFSNPGTCTGIAAYEDIYATQIRFELSYYAQAPGGGQPVRRPLATYYSQTGHNGYDTPSDRDNCNAEQEAAGLPACGSRTAGDHNTDLRWVSPGGSRQTDMINAYGGAGSGIPRSAWVDVPTEFGSFEVNLNSDVPDIITDPTSGARYLYLDITSVNGTGENGFEIWAGPNTYTATTSSEANARNIQILNDPGIHSSLGASVFALGRMPMNSNFSSAVDIPLIFVPASYAGQTVYVSLFDPDTSGTKGPIVFYFDSIAFEPDELSHTGYDEGATDWAMSFDQGLDGGVKPPDDDGEPAYTRCSLSGNGCNNRWVDPAYRITIPNQTSACPVSPTPQEQRDYCTPFYGGILTARYQAGLGDTYTWQIQLTGSPFLVR